MNIDVKFSETDTNFDVGFKEGNSTPSTNDHSLLTNRDKAEQHPISAITGLEKALNDKLNSSALPTAIDTALAQAKESGEFDGKDGINGKDGTDGKDGKSPYIAENGNWMVWDAETNKYVDTGISAASESGGMTEEEREQLSQNTEDIKTLKQSVGTLEGQVGDFETALDELHTYAQSLITGGASE